MTQQHIYDWLIRLFLDILLIFIFLFIFLHPLWKLSKSRRAIIILFSRAIGSLLRLFAEMPGFLVNYILNISASPFIIYLINVSITFFDTVLATHIMALAVNRAHGIIFPFHYNMFTAKKRNFYLLCALLWLFSLIVAFLDQTVRIWSKYSIWPFLIIHKICMVFGAICYAALSYKLVHLKYKKSPKLWSVTSSEKDPFRISIVCFSCLLMSSLRYLVISPIQSTTWPFVWQVIMTWLSVVTNLLAVCTEEICLFFLVHEFRKDVIHQIKYIFCCFTKRTSSTNAVIPFS